MNNVINSEHRFIDTLHKKHYLQEFKNIMEDLDEDFLEKPKCDYFDSTSSECLFNESSCIPLFEGERFFDVTSRYWHALSSPTGQEDLVLPSVPPLHSVKHHTEFACPVITLPGPCLFMRQPPTRYPGSYFSRHCLILNAFPEELAGREMSAVTWTTPMGCCAVVFDSTAKGKSIDIYDRVLKFIEPFNFPRSCPVCPGRMCCCHGTAAVSTAYLGGFLQFLINTNMQGQN
ncbi:hypothetical protein J6590_014583 [Homalodisca vitripennis]|nr:hypothetical protein J6590_014583 [Homalodisca vitripennis]